jgi:hypothetical protein
MNAYITPFLFMLYGVQIVWPYIYRASDIGYSTGWLCALLNLAIIVRLSDR